MSYLVCAQFLLMHLACLLALRTGVSAAALAACLALYLLRMFAITAGFHRLFSHRSYRTGRLFQFLLAFAATELRGVRRRYVRLVQHTALAGGVIDGLIRAVEGPVQLARLFP